MIPGRQECHGSGWTREYWGNLVTAHYGHAAQHEFICMDMTPEVRGSTANQDGALVYVVQGQCGSLPCGDDGPYVNNQELTCVVCTKGDPPVRPQIGKSFSCPYGDYGSVTRSANYKNVNNS